VGAYRLSNDRLRRAGEPVIVPKRNQATRYRATRYRVTRHRVKRHRAN
jgi:hypothetical protein